MNWPFRIARQLSAKEQKSFSKTIIRLAIVAVALSSAVMIIALATVSGFQQGIKKKVIGVQGHIIIDNIRNTEGSVPAPLSDSFLDVSVAIRSVAGIEKAGICALKPCIVKTEGEIDGMIAKGVDPDFDFSYFQSNLVNGTIPDLAKDSNQVLISTVTAKRLNLKTGDFLQAIFFREDSSGNQRARAIAPKICGIFNTGLDEYDKTLLITSRKLIRKMLPKGYGFTQWEIRLGDFNQAEVVKTELERKLPAGVFSVNTVQRYNRQIFDWLNLLDTNVVIILVLMVLVAAINMCTTLLILITERTQMVGVLKAMGAHNARIRWIFIYQALFIAFVGLVAGNIIGAGFCVLQAKYAFVKLNVETYYVDHVLIDLQSWHILAVNAGTMLLCLLVLFLPASIVSRLTPVKTMRFQ